MQIILFELIDNILAIDTIIYEINIFYSVCY